MQIKNTILPTLIALIVIFTGQSSCKRMLDVPPRATDIGIGRTFNDSASAVAAVTGVYTLMVTHGYFEFSGLSYNTARSADEARYYGATDFFADNDLKYTNSDVYSMWVQGFRTMLLINTCLKGLQMSTRLSHSLHQQLSGEMLFSRAFINFLLVNIWGDAIPLITSPDIDDNEFAKSVSRQKIYDQILADLQQAQSLLSEQYPTAGRVRPNVMAVHALLARVYLYQSRYNEAVTASGKVINSNLYLPLPAVPVAFLASSRETIWQLMPDNNTVADPVLYRWSATALSSGLLAAFEPSDLRRQYWVADNLFRDSVYISAHKYKKEPNMTTLPVEYYVVFRLAEQYLIRAEAVLKLGRVGEAIADINMIRIRAGLPSLPASLTAAQCMQAIEQERRVELFTEWGHRWFDLKRWAGTGNPSLTRADEVLGSIKPDWQPTDKWYPVPQAELRVNPFLVQNPGYPAQ